MRNKIVLLAGAIGVIGSNSLALSPISAAVGADLGGAAASDVMRAAAGYGVGVAVGGLFLAPIADRIGASKLLVRAFALFAVALAAAALAPTLWALIVAETLAGLIVGAGLPAIYALGAQIAPLGRENAVTGYLLTGWTVSMVLGVPLSAFVADIASWRASLGALAAGALLAALLIARQSDWGDRTDAPHKSGLDVFAVPGLAAGIGVVAGFMTAFYGLYTYVGAHVVERLDLSTTVAGAVGLAYGAGFGAAVLVSSSLSARVAPIIYLTISAVYIGLGFASSAGAALVGVAAIWGFANHLGMNLLIARLTALDPSRRGAVMGLYGAATYFSVAIGAIAFRPVFEAYGFFGCALVAAICVAPAAALSLPKPAARRA